MSRKKRLRKQEGQASASSSQGAPALKESSAPANRPAADPSAARRLAVFGIGFCGLFMGLVTGVNHIPEAPASVLDPAARALFQGAVLGVQQLDWPRGLQLALAGWVFGITAGVSLILEPARTLGAWVLGSLGLAAGLGLGLGPVPAALGWLIGFMTAVKAIAVPSPTLEGARPARP